MGVRVKLIKSAMVLVACPVFLVVNTLHYWAASVLKMAIELLTIWTD